jgi:UDP-N-acetylmuramoyl-tripeptide--D-alanyl-D-alanine ligase
MSIESLYAKYLESHSVCTDTRNIIEGSIFFALKGASFNGNLFAEQALEAGCSWAVVDEPVNPDNDRLILVEDVLNSLQELASYHRSKLDIPVFGITGSNGKTTTKELLHAALSTKFNTFATKGNLNNHIGVPLSLLCITPEMEFAIIEMGANHQKEIEFLCGIAKPDYGLITNIGEAHLEGFGGIEGVMKGKGELFDYLRSSGGTAFVNDQMEYLPEMVQGLVAISYTTSAEPYNLSITQQTPTLAFTWGVDQTQYEVQSNLTGEYNLHNFAAAIAVSSHFGADATRVSSALADYAPSNHRSQVVEKNGNLLILDSYNANPSSMKEALRNLASMESSRKFFVIGDMLEMGERSTLLHEDILTLSQQLGLEGLTVGKEFGKVASRKALAHFETAEEAGDYLKNYDLKDSAILIKGSRGIQLEKLLQYL